MERLFYKDAARMIRENYPLPDYLTKSKGNMYACPFCGSGTAGGRNSDGAVKYYPNTATAFCFSCKAYFDVLDVLAHDRDEGYTPGHGGKVWRETIVDAARELGCLVEFTGSAERARARDLAAFDDKLVSEPDAPTAAGNPPSIGRQLAPLDVPPADRWKEQHAAALECEYLLKRRGIPRDVIARHPDGIGYSKHSHPFPTWRGSDGKPRDFEALIFRPTPYTYMMRLIDPPPEVRTEKPLNKVEDKDGNERDELRPHLWNAAALDGEKPVFVVEGIIDALSIEAAGGAAVALLGTSFTKSLWREIDKRRAAGKRTPVIIEALDDDKNRADGRNPGREAAARMQKEAKARGVFLAGGASIVGAYKDANEAWNAEPEAFAGRVHAAEAAAMSEAPPADKEGAAPAVPTLPELPTGARGVVNPDALGASDLLFLTAGTTAATALVSCGASAVGANSRGALSSVFDMMNERKTRRETLPPAIVDCYPRDEKSRAVVNDILRPKCKALGIVCMNGTPIFTQDENALHTLEQIGDFVESCRAERRAAEEEERREYEKTTAADKLTTLYNHSLHTRPFSLTGFSELDSVMDGGFYPGLHLIGAVSSLGKTTFVVQIADAVAKNGQDVLLFSLEMDDEEIMAKSISRLSYELADEKKRPDLAFSIRDVLTGSKKENWYSDQWENYVAAYDRYGLYAQHIRIIEADGAMTVEDIRDRVEKHIRLTGRKPLIIVDYLQILAPALERATDKQNVDYTAVRLKQIARDFSLPVLAISSFNRDNYNNPVSTAALKESGNLEYGADIIWGLQFYGYDLESKDSETKRRTRLEKLRKAREADKAAGNPIYIQLRFLKVRNSYGRDLFFRYHPRYNAYEECTKDECDSWESLAINEIEVVDTEDDEQKTESGSSAAKKAKKGTRY